MTNKEEILKLVSEYIAEKHAAKTWTPGMDWVQYSGPYFNSEEYVRSIGKLLDEWLVLGDDAMRFEKLFPPLLGKKYGVVTNSGSSANLLMMLAAQKTRNFPKGSKVIVPVAGFPTTVNPLLQLGFEPVFVDIELDTLNLDLEQVEKAIVHGAKIITFAHVLGNPPNMDRVKELVSKHQLVLLEDCCDALGTTYNDLPVGGDGIMATCSFYPAHHITMGEGGFVACSTEEEEKVLRSFREWGRGCYCVGKKANLSPKGTCGCRFNKWLPSLPDEIFDHKYVYENIGYNLKPLDLQCSMGLAQLQKLPEIHRLRRENHKRLTEIFSPYEEFFHIHKATPKSNPSWFAFPITLKNHTPFRRSHFTSFLEDHKIQTRNYFGGNLLLQPGYNNVSYRHVWGNYLGQSVGSSCAKICFPVATKITTDTLFLGTSPVITPKQLDYVEQTVNKFFKSI
jgi:CDP-6-deoxy-D-xylo-4-hexulose-3-dehydrase